jgi:Integrase core domain
MWLTKPIYRLYGAISTRTWIAMAEGYVARAIGSIRQECLDHVIVVGEAHLRRILAGYIEHYNAARTHLGIAKDAPDRRPIERCGAIIAVPALGGLHHRYARI